MSIFDRFFPKLRKPVSTKDPSYVVTNFTKNNHFQNIIDLGNNKNYLDQYILYTYKCIEMISDTMINTKPILTIDGDTENSIEEDPLQKDLFHFNEYQSLNEARKITQTHLRLTGIAAWVMQEPFDRRNKVDFYILDPTKLQIKTDDYGLPAAYEYRDGNGVQVKFDTEEVIYFRRPNPKNWFEGYSQVEAMSYIANSYSAGAQMNQNRMLNNGMPDFLLYFEDIDDEERDRLEGRLQQKYGGPRKAGRQGVITAKPEKIDLQDTNKDLQYIEGMKMMRQDILAIFGVPEALVFPSSTNANTKEAMKTFQQLTIQPALQTEVDTWNEQLIPKYYGTSVGPRFKDRLIFTFKDPVDQDKLEDSTVVQNYVSAGATLNQALEIVGLPPVEGGDDKQSQTEPAKPEEDTEDIEEDDSSKALASITVKLKEIEDRLLEDSRVTERALFKKKALKEATDQEIQLQRVTYDSLLDQAVRWIQKYDKKNPTLRSLPKLTQENEIVANSYKPKMQEIVGQTNNDANVEIKQKLFKSNSKQFLAYRDKSLTPDDMSEVDQYLEVFAKEINTKTLNDFKKLIAEGIRNGFDNITFKNDIANLFNGYLDGVKNISILKELGYYQEAISVNVDGQVVTQSNNRYNSMLETITKAQGAGEITLEQQNEALTALKGVVDKSDPIGSQVNSVLKNIYNIPDGSSKISENRAVRIARTTSTYARNFSLDKTYTDNPFVKSTEWVAVGDRFTRDSHASADGQVSPVGKPFIVGGEKMRFPGDPNGSAENVINCRCRTIANV